MIQKYASILSGHRRLAIKALALSVLSGLMEGAALIVLLPVLSEGMGQGSGSVQRLLATIGLPHLNIFLCGVGAFCALGLASTLARHMSDYSCLSLRTAIEERARTLVGHALADMDWAHFNTLRLGAISQAVMIDPSQIGSGTYFFIKASAAVIVAASLLAVTIAISFTNTLFTLAFAGISFGLLRIFNTKTTPLSNTLSTLSELLQIKTSALFDNLKFFRSSGNLSTVLSEVDEISRKFSRAYVRCYGHGQGIRSLLECCGIFYISLFLILNLGTGSMPLPEMLVFLGVFYRTIPRILQAQESYFFAKGYLSWFDAWEQRMLLARANPSPPSGQAAPSFVRSLDLHLTEFNYPGQEQPVLRDIHFSMLPGSTLAIVGPSGGGKSTLLDIITGLLACTRGEVLLDGFPLGSLDRAQWQRKVGLVLQDSPIFHGTLQDNVTLGDPAPDAGRLEQTLRQADLWDFVQTLPLGVMTQVGEKGGRLSGGQCQRLAIARALYRDPALLLMDEPTSSLDAVSEQQFIDTLAHIKGQSTMLIVTHQIKVARLADRIIVIDGGKIVEQGTWEELAAIPHGVFADLARRQGLLNAEALQPRCKELGEAS